MHKTYFRGWYTTMKDFPNPNRPWQPPTHRIRSAIHSTPLPCRMICSTMLSSRMRDATLERGVYHEYEHRLPHGTIWSESRNPVVAGKELHRQQEEDVVLSTIPPADGAVLETSQDPMQTSPMQTPFAKTTSWSPSRPYPFDE